MDWIESHIALGTHPKIKNLARALSTSRPAAVGHMMYLWWWATRHAFDGDLSAFDTDDLAEAARWDGDPDTFVKALIECGPRDRYGFVNPDMTLHDWEEHTEAYRQSQEEGRRGAHKRWHVDRNQPKATCEFCVADGLISRQDSSQGPSSDLSQASRTTPDAPLVGPHWGANAPDLTRPDLTRHNPTSSPQPPKPATDADAPANPDDDEDDPPTGDPQPLDGTWRLGILDPAGRTDWTPLRYTTAVLDAIAIDDTDGTTGHDRLTSHAMAMADHMAEIRGEPAGTGAVHELRALVLEHPPARVLAALHDASTRSGVRSPIGYARRTLQEDTTT